MRMRNLLGGCESARPSEAWVLHRCMCVCMGTSCKQNRFIYSTKPIKLLRTIKNMLKIQLFKNSRLNTHSRLFSFSTFLFETSIIPLWFFPLVLLTLSGMCLVLHPTMPHWQWSFSAATSTSKSTLYCLLNYCKRPMTLFNLKYTWEWSNCTALSTSSTTCLRRDEICSKGTRIALWIISWPILQNVCMWTKLPRNYVMHFFKNCWLQIFYYALVNLKFFFQEIFTHE